MSFYTRNRACSCVRCRARGLMGAAVLVTLGVLFLLDNFNVIEFDRSWPVMLLAIGGVLLLSHSGSTAGHIQPTWTVGQPVVPQTSAPSQPWSTGTPAPPQPPQPSQSQPDDPQVKS